jgi:hypothetical protein
VKLVFRRRRWKKVNGQSEGRPHNYCDIGNLEAAMQNVRAATEASALGVRRLLILLSMIYGMVCKNVLLNAVNKRRRHAGAVFAFQLIAANLRQRQISKDQEKENANYPVMQAPYSC